MPDVAGGEATARGLPRRQDLTLRQRAVVDASAVADLGLRTAIASLVGAAMLPPVFGALLGRGELAAERRRLEFFAEVAAAGDADRSFPAPDEPPRVSVRPAAPLAEWVAHGRVEQIRFASGFRPLNPEMRSLWSGFGRNNTVAAQHWRHNDGPRPTLCVIHGFLGSPYLLNGLFFSLPWFFRSGYDIVLYTLPFHGSRAEKGSPFSGYGVFANGLSGFAETMGQAVFDFRSLLDYLEHTGVDRVALTGMSLGGYTSALIASADHRLQAVIPNVPVVAPERLLDTWFPANRLVSFGRLANGISREAADAAAAFHSPLNYRPQPAKDRRLIITGLGDRLAPPEHAEELWRHWDRCALHWFPGNHVLHVSQPDYLRRMTRFLGPVMF
ncbi:alpha/beta hydrolase [Mycolicibacterium brumae]|uniref:Abhydrolase domain-containing 18 n=1 Tax=Mycolicibacterium brumae TaxID=85968 RepID=A0A2G5PG54_9MYCO|nr:prolyl oligopeptidase family serine peptidase [Mycolicibacterium brumae]MCV7194254.1 prolyl oligopeptidase family serine peptidase [Mycolicibacterium brumae]PIB77288.1 abhydrolase domain-containing 18 [Mycolicibacterium brumae]UWW10441.1 prolyl oligopeptidase family serine peptidase [Mycolicibacterium brumae]